jgi:hypothetical protein
MASSDEIMKIFDDAFAEIRAAAHEVLYEIEEERARTGQLSEHSIDTMQRFQMILYATSPEAQTIVGKLTEKNGGKLIPVDRLSELLFGIDLSTGESVIGRPS